MLRASQMKISLSVRSGRKGFEAEVPPVTGCNARYDKLRE